MIFLLQERNVWRKIVWYTAATEGHWKCLSLGFLWYGKWYQSICTACDFYHENTSLFQEPCFGNFFCTTDQQPSRFWWYFPPHRLILILLLKCRTDILTQERVVIRSTTNYVVSCTHIFTLHTPQILSTRKGPFMTTLCEQAMFFRQRKPCIPCLITRQRRRCIGANTLYTLLPASVKRRATGLFWQGFYHHWPSWWQWALW